MRTESPEGRRTRDSLDARGRVMATRNAADSVVRLTRDADGRVTRIEQGDRSVDLGYGTDGLPSLLINPVSDTTEFHYDSAGRLTRQELPDTNELRIFYDAHSNIDSIRPPGRPAHGFRYDALDLVTEYRPPAFDTLVDPATTFAYNLDRQLTRVARPDGDTVSLAYDTAGRIEELDFTGGLVGFAYSATTGTLTEVSGPYGDSLGLSYDGSLLTGMR